MSLNFKLDENYKISSDSRNFTLEKLHDVADRETGKTKKVWKDVGYYWSLGHLLDRYANEHLRDVGDTDVKKLIVMVRELHNHVEKIGEQLKVDVEKVHSYYSE